MSHERRFADRSAGVVFLDGNDLSKTGTNSPLDSKLTDELGRKLGATYSSVLEDAIPADLLDLVKKIESKLAESKV